MDYNDSKNGYQRKSNIELLRIVAMAIIVMHHYSVHSNFIITNDITWNKLFIQLFGFGGKVGVDVFVIITGFFMIQMSFKLEKLVKLLGEIWFYGIAILIFAVCKPLDTVNIKNIIHSILPFGQTNWFAYTYLVLYVLIPVLNQGIKNLSQVLYKKTLLIGGICWFAIPTFIPFLTFQESPLLMFIYLYALGAYIRLYVGNISKNRITQLMGIGIGGIVVGTVLIDIFTIFYPGLLKHVFYFVTKGYSVFALLLALSLFFYFNQLNIRYNRYINMIASTTFGIYLIHDSDLLKDYIWNQIFNPMYYHSIYLPVYAIYAVVLVFSLGAIIDYIRINTLERTVMRKVGPYCKQLQERANKYWNVNW